MCVLEGSNDVKGTIYFENMVKGGSTHHVCSLYYTICLQGDGKTKVTGTVKGLKPGKHGFHVHQFGDYSGGCISAGPHFNPFGKDHGGPADENRHAGDLGNVMADATGTVTVEIVDKQLPLDGPNSIIGRSVVVSSYWLGQV